MNSLLGLGISPYRLLSWGILECAAKEAKKDDLSGEHARWYLASKHAKDLADLANLNINPLSLLTDRPIMMDYERVLS